MGHECGSRVSSDSLSSSISVVRFLLECLWFLFSKGVYVACQVVGNTFFVAFNCETSTKCIPKSVYNNLLKNIKNYNI